LVVCEGYREACFLEHLSQYSEVRLNLQFCGGGSGSKVVGDGIKYSARGGKVFVFFDEDFQMISDLKIQDDILDGLEFKWMLEKDSLKDRPYRSLQLLNSSDRNPILVVSWPNSIEGFLLRLLGTLDAELRGKNTRVLKKLIDIRLEEVVLEAEDIVLSNKYQDKIDRYATHIQTLSVDEPNYKAWCKSFNSKIDECKRKKNQVVFMRFLNRFLPLSVLQAKRSTIPEIDILLKAFNL